VRSDCAKDRGCAKGVGDHCISHIILQLYAFTCMTTHLHLEKHKEKKGENLYPYKSDVHANIRRKLSFSHQFEQQMSKSHICPPFLTPKSAFLNPLHSLPTLLPLATVTA
jgi:hypothetical protein